MIIRVEIGIDIDAKRKIWLQADASPVKPEDAEQISAALIEGVTTQALAVQAVQEQRVEVDPAASAVVAAARASGPQEPPPSQRRPRPEDPESMRAFGEDEDDDAN